MVHSNIAHSRKWKVVMNCKTKQFFNLWITKYLPPLPFCTQIRSFPCIQITFETQKPISCSYEYKTQMFISIVHMHWLILPVQIDFTTCILYIYTWSFIHYSVRQLLVFCVWPTCFKTLISNDIIRRNDNLTDQSNLKLISWSIIMINMTDYRF